MSAPRDEPTDAVLTRIVLDVDGVSDVFSPASAVGQVPEIVTALVTRDADAVTRVRVRSSAKGTDIATRIAVDRAAGAPAAARAAADALLAAVPAGGDVTVSVEVSRIS